ncbi:hypothetical protein, partial [Nonomuraea turkmeniaca]|uniref:hypothetical protein n=1 Tax=Nonomuraea turkmeniaca TaxID=103838 RepID=UPI001B87C222
MKENPEELPEAVGGVEGESDVVAERSGAETPRARRPIPADPPDLLDPPDRHGVGRRRGSHEHRTGLACRPISGWATGPAYVSRLSARSA